MKSPHTCSVLVLDCSQYNHFIVIMTWGAFCFPCICMYFVNLFVLHIYVVVRVRRCFLVRGFATICRLPQSSRFCGGAGHGRPCVSSSIVLSRLRGWSSISSGQFARGLERSAPFSARIFFYFCCFSVNRNFNLMGILEFPTFQNNIEVGGE